MSTDGSAYLAAIDEFIEKASDLRGAWPEVGKVWAEREKSVFETGSFGRWAPLKSATILDKQKSGLGTTPMIETGSLIHGVTNPTPSESGPLYAVFGPGGSAPDYAKYHLNGRGVPQRNPVPKLTPTERKRFVEKVAKHLGMTP